MKFTAVFVALAAATLANAQGYNHTSSSHSAPVDSRTLNLPSTRASSPPTAITSIYTATSHCGSVLVYRPQTSVYPLSGSGAVASRSATFSGSGSGSGSAASATARSSGGASLPTAFAGMGVAAIAGIAGAIML